MSESPLDRLRRLYEALLTITTSMAGFEPIGVNAGGRGGTVRYRSPRGSEALLDVRPERVSVTTRSADLNPHAGNSTIVDDLGIDLTEGYLWDDVTCESPDELAGLLIKHMLRRAKEADPEPLVGETR